MSSLGSSTSTVRPVSLPPMPLPLLPFLCSALHHGQTATLCLAGHALSLCRRCCRRLSHTFLPFRRTALSYLPCPPPACSLQTRRRRCLYSTPLMSPTARCKSPKNITTSSPSWRTTRVRRKTAPCFFGVSFVCPEPVLANHRYHGRGMPQRQLPARFCCREMQRSDGEGPSFDRPTLP